MDIIIWSQNLWSLRGNGVKGNYAISPKSWGIRSYIFSLFSHTCVGWSQNPGSSPWGIAPVPDTAGLFLWHYPWHAPQQWSPWPEPSGSSFFHNDFQYCWHLLVPIWDIIDDTFLGSSGLDRLIIKLLWDSLKRKCPKSIIDVWVHSRVP